MTFSLFSTIKVNLQTLSKIELRNKLRTKCLLNVCDNIISSILTKSIWRIPIHNIVGWNSHCENWHKASYFVEFAIKLREQSFFPKVDEGDWRARNGTFLLQFEAQSNWLYGSMQNNKNRKADIKCSIYDARQYETNQIVLYHTRAKHFRSCDSKTPFIKYIDWGLTDKLPRHFRNYATISMRMFELYVTFINRNVIICNFVCHTRLPERKKHRITQI